MSRYTGPKNKKARRYGFSLQETGKEFAKGKQRTTAPGHHGAKKVKLSDYGLHLYEKQKVKFMYGLTERQFKTLAQKALKSEGVSGTVIMQTLESRLDNLVYRAGFAASRRQARQLVSHGHFTLNGHKADIASMQISVGDVIELKAKSHENVQIKEAMQAKPAAGWLTRDGFKVKYDRLPERKELNQEINEALIVEFYSR